MEAEHAAWLHVSLSDRQRFVSSQLVVATAGISPAEIADLWPASAGMNVNGSRRPSTADREITDSEAASPPPSPSDATVPGGACRLASRMMPGTQPPSGAAWLRPGGTPALGWGARGEATHGAAPLGQCPRDLRRPTRSPGTPAAEADVMPIFQCLEALSLRMCLRAPRRRTSTTASMACRRAARGGLGKGVWPGQRGRAVA